MCKTSGALSWMLWLLWATSWGVQAGTLDVSYPPRRRCRR